VGKQEGRERKEKPEEKGAKRRENGEIASESFLVYIWSNIE